MSYPMEPNEPANKPITHADLERDALRAAMRSDLHIFIKKTFLELEGKPLKDNWHIAALACRLTRFITGDIKRLIITLPPRYLKSVSSSIAAVAWALGLAPNRKFMCVSYGENLCVKLAKDTERIMNTAWYKALFPKTRLETATKEVLKTIENGERWALTLGGAITGLGADYIIVDDINKANDVMYESKREATLEFFEQTLVSRLNNKQEGGILVIQQRLHQYDLVGQLLEKGIYDHLNLPAIAEEYARIPIGPGKHHERFPGDVLHPEYESREVLEQIKIEMGESKFLAQYQQRPAPAKGTLVKWEWFQRYESLNWKCPGSVRIQTWDTAYTANETSDYSVCMTWLVYKDCYCLADVCRVKLEYPALKALVIHKAREFGTNILIFELAATGLTLHQELRAEREFNVTGAHPTASKEARLIEALPSLQKGMVYLPQSAEWIDDFKSEMLSFPYGKHDDQVDSLSLFLYAARVNFPGSPYVYQPAL